MKRALISQIYKTPESFTQDDITVCGWIRTKRNSKTLCFLEINDGSSFNSLQVVFEDEKVRNFKEVCKLNAGAAVVVKGKLLLTPDAAQPFEVNATSIEV